MAEINDEVDTQEIVEPIPKRKPGRPAGSKNKKHVAVAPAVTPEPKASAPPKALPKGRSARGVHLPARTVPPQRFAPSDPSGKVGLG